MYALPAIELRQYDGTNSADLLAWMDEVNGLTVTLTSEANGVLTLFWDNGDGSGPAVLNTGDWASCSGVWVQVITGADFAEKWVKVAE
jgi:hypothetical protein